MKRIMIKELIKDDAKTLVGIDVLVKGWIKSIRRGKKFSFLVIGDGSSQKNLQVVADADLKGYEELSSLPMGSAVEIMGNLALSSGQGQIVELQAKEFKIYGKVDADYPLQKKATSLEFLRENAHLRMRTNLFGAVFRVRHALAMGTHEFFSRRDFYYLNSPILTAIDAEGAGEMFRVSTLAPDATPKLPNGGYDFSKDYFGCEANLTVTGQLAGECFALGMGQVYTFGPTFRSENSNTARHLAEFWMIEPEVAFAHLDDIAVLATDYIKYLIDYALKNCHDELVFLSERQLMDGEDRREENSEENSEENDDGKNHLDNLKHVRDSEFVKITYTEAMEILEKSGVKFEYPVGWGHELQTEHERFLAEKHFKLPVIVTDYPKEFKAFYMKQNPDGKTVKAMDILVPGVGELIGGSEREDDIVKLKSRMSELNMNEAPLWWYLDLRRFGSVPHSGFGLGFERALMYITGLKNIRDVIPFPRTPKNCNF